MKPPSLPLSLLVLVAASSLVGAPGCALTNAHVWPPVVASSTTVEPRLPDREVILEMPFVDARLDQTRCGMKKNGYGTPTANIVCDVPPTRWLSDQLVQGLAAAGIHVIVRDAQVPASPGDAPTDVHLHADVLVFFVEANEADTSVKLTATAATGFRAERTFYVKGVSNAALPVDGMYEEAARDSSLVAVNSMVKAVADLLVRFPELGHRPAPPAVALGEDVVAR